MSWRNRSISLFRVTIARRCLLSYKIHKKLFRLEFYFSGKKVNFIVVLASPCFFAFTFIGYISNLKENNFLWEKNYARFCGFKNYVSFHVDFKKQLTTKLISHKIQS